MCIVNFYTLWAKHNFFPPSTCFFCSLDGCILLIHLCLDISKNKSWILQSGFHCFLLLKLSQTIAQERRISHAQVKKKKNQSRIHQDSVQIQAAAFSHSSVDSTRSRAARASRASRNKPGFRQLFQHRSQGRRRRRNRPSIHDSPAHVAAIPEGRKGEANATVRTTNPG